ncbi:MAG: NAD(P)/FAD-dependent oxidoreductase [Bacteriovoracaceae bacterium]
MKTPHVVIVGGGFGGLSAARVLANRPIRVTLIDKRNYHLFQPLLYQVATAGLSPAEIAYPLRALLSRAKNIEVLLGKVQEINKEEKWLITEANKVNFDYLIMSCGSTYTYFNSPQWEPFATSLKTISQATEIRKKIFLAFEKAERESDIEKRKSLLTFVVVGGGPTGVELAGSLGEITRYSITQDFRHIQPEQTRIILIEAGHRILPTMTEKLSIEAMRELEELGVQVWTNSMVTNINEKGIQIGNEFISSCTILWAAGVASNNLNQKLNVPLDRQGRVLVQKDLSVAGYPYLFIIGDQAHFDFTYDKRPLPGLAPVAMQQGRFVAKNLIRKIKSKPLVETFHYVDKGQLATVGRSRAVGMYKNIEFSGLIAWVTWLMVHIYYLIGFKNRIFVLFQWAWTYLTFRRGARLIIDEK